MFVLEDVNSFNSCIEEYPYMAIIDNIHRSILDSTFTICLFICIPCNENAVMADNIRIETHT